MGDRRIREEKEQETGIKLNKRTAYKKGNE